MRPAIRKAVVIIAVVVFVIAHYLASVFSMYGFFLGAMSTKPQSWLGKVEAMFVVLTFPANMFMVLMGGMLSVGAVGMLVLLFANSLLWGAALAALLGWPLRLGRNVANAIADERDV